MMLLNLRSVKKTEEDSDNGFKYQLSTLKGLTPLFLNNVSKKNRIHQMKLKYIVLSLMLVFSLSGCKSFISQTQELVVSHLEKEGFIKPRPQESENMKVTGGGFILNVTKDGIEAKYSILLNLKNLENVDTKNMWILAEFQNPNKWNDYQKKVIPIQTSDKFINIQSNNIYGFQRYRAYLVSIRLFKDKEGKGSVDKLRQYLRANFSN